MHPHKSTKGGASLICIKNHSLMKEKYCRSTKSKISKSISLFFLVGTYSLLICGCQDTIISSENSIVESTPVEEWTFENSSSETSQDIAMAKIWEERKLSAQEIEKNSEEYSLAIERVSGDWFGNSMIGNPDVFPDKYVRFREDSVITRYGMYEEGRYGKEVYDELTSIKKLDEEYLYLIQGERGDGELYQYSYMTYQENPDVLEYHST